MAVQSWVPLMFTRRVVGTANATVAGWGNLGGGLTQVGGGRWGGHFWFEKQYWGKWCAISVNGSFSLFPPGVNDRPVSSSGGLGS